MVIRAASSSLQLNPCLPINRRTPPAILLAERQTEAGEPLDVGRKTRNIPPAIRRALQARDQGCRFHHRCVHEEGTVTELLPTSRGRR